MRFILVLLLIWASNAPAQSVDLQGVLGDALEKLYGTTFTKHHRVSSQGELTGCTIEFKILARDFAYKNGQPVFLVGSFGFWNHPTAIAVFSMKLSLHDQRFVNNRVTMIPQQPYFTYLASADDSKSNAHAFIDSKSGDTPGARLFRFNLDAEMISAILDNKVKLVFNRTRGGMDVKVPLDLLVVEMDDNGKRTHAPTTMLEFAACAQEFFRNAEKRNAARK